MTESMTTLLPSAFDSQDCRFPGCPREATNVDDGMCRDHHGRTPAPAGAVTATHDSGGRLIPGALAHLMDEDPLEQQVGDGRIHPGFLAHDPDDDLVIGHEPAVEPDPTPDIQEEPSVTQRVWDRDNIIEAVKAFHAKHGRTPRQSELRVANGLPSQNAIAANFGSMGACFKAAGLASDGRRATRTRAARRPGPAAAPPPVAPAQPTPATDPAARLSELVVVIEGRRNELIDLQAEALGLLDQIREAIAA